MLPRVSSDEPSRRWPVPASSQLVHAGAAIELLPAVQVVVRCSAGAGDLVAEGVELVSVADRAGGIGQEADVPVAVIAVEARRPGAADFLVLADALQAVGVRAGHRTVDHPHPQPAADPWD